MSADVTRGINYQHRCKICNLANNNPSVFKELHQHVLESGMSYVRAMNMINDKIERESLPISKLNSQNMGVHFGTHVTLPDKVNSAIIKAQTNGVPLKDVAPDMGYYVEDMVRRKVGNEVNDYLNLDSLRSGLMEKLEALDAITSQKNDDGKDYVNMDAMAQYVVIAREIRNTITDLNRIRSSKQLMTMIIKSLVEKNTFEIVREISREYEQIKRDMLEAGLDQSTATRIDQQLRMRLAQIVSTTARQAVEDVVKTYKLDSV